MSDITFFLTSCKRHDLLRICLETFEQYNTCPIERGIIIEDSDMDISWCKDVLKSIPNLELINTGGRQGQVRNIDRCYATIDTKYVFHCEDDFTFTRAGFVEASLKVLEAEPMCINVWLTGYEKEWEAPGRNHLPPDHRQFNLDGVTYWNVKSYVSGEEGLGFTFQPSVHRIGDWRSVGGYENLIKSYAPWANMFDGGQTERNIARYYINQGYHTRMFAGPNDNEEGYVYNTGQTRHVPLPGSDELNK
jgi:hypothetical protein